MHPTLPLAVPCYRLMPRVDSFQSCQLKAAEKNDPVHDKELLAMKSIGGAECTKQGGRAHGAAALPSAPLLGDAGLLYYQVDGGDEPRIAVPNDEALRLRVLY
ncbi:unnamed protein product [Phytophthora fragariaefolia]|uniref:Unnamed protein product n=1 Tax=Phytophthora fragariaefolia TaxID=1490495 RepID=A0A9W6Y6K8_9STRA|nr:unnamed protein product [Phytophthora fragariaefolia]